LRPATASQIFSWLRSMPNDRYTMHSAAAPHDPGSCCGSNGTSWAGVIFASRHDGHVSLTGGDLKAGRAVGIAAAVLADDRGHVADRFALGKHLRAALLVLGRPLDLAGDHATARGAGLVPAGHRDLRPLHDCLL